MSKTDIEHRIAELKDQLNDHNYRYYVLAQPVISDYEFDKLLEELIRLEKEYPAFLTSDSPSQRVGGAVTKEFRTVKHRYPMLSLGNTYSEDELREFEERVIKLLPGEKIEFVCKFLLALKL